VAQASKLAGCGFDGSPSVRGGVGREARAQREPAAGVVGRRRETRARRDGIKPVIGLACASRIQ